MKDNLEIVEYLVGKGADVNCKANDEVSMQFPEHKHAHVKPVQHRTRQAPSELLRIHTICTPVKSVAGPFEVSYWAFSAIVVRRGVPVGVVYAGNSVILRG